MQRLSIRLFTHSLIPALLLVIGVQNVKAETTNCIPISGIPHTITMQGVYCLTGHLSSSLTNGKMIDIQTNNVTIDLNGFKIGGLGAGLGTSAIGIYAEKRKNITIRNGSIRGFLQGIFLADTSPFTTSSGHLIEDIRADGNTWIGIQAHGTGNHIRNNKVINTGGTTVNNLGFGIALFGPNTTIEGNTVSSTTVSSTAYGIYVDNAPASLIKNNQITDTMGTSNSFAIYIGSSAHVAARENDIMTANNGIYYFASSGKYMDNLTSNIITDFFGGTAIGNNN